MASNEIMDVDESVLHQESIAVHRQSLHPFRILIDDKDISGTRVGIRNAFTRIEEISRQAEAIVEHEKIYGRIRRMYKVLREKFRFQWFLYEQEKIIYKALNKEDVVVVFPTGSGKSLCFQLPAILDTGITVVVAPLIALIIDQIESLTRRAIGAVTLFSEQSFTEQARTKELLLSGRVRFLYMTPEKITRDDARSTLTQIKNTVGLARIVIDEAHLISSWGHAFRPEYRQLGELRRDFPDVPFMALTATATMAIVQDIKAQLRIPDASVFMEAPNQGNLIHTVRLKENNTDVVDDIVELLTMSPPQSSINASSKGIVYCRQISTCESVAKLISQRFAVRGKVAHFHSQMSKAEKEAIIRSFQREDISSCQIIVATTAFGMGIDKSSVRFVIHVDPPESLLAYVQESGRAGRDGRMAISILYYRAGDIFRKLAWATKEGNKELIEEIHKMHQYCTNFTTCRRQLLLDYFGQDSAQYYPENCHKTCDNCQSPGEVIDWTDIAQHFAWEARNYVLQQSYPSSNRAGNANQSADRPPPNPTVRVVVNHFLRLAKKNDWILPPFESHQDIPISLLEELCCRLAVRRILGMGVRETSRGGGHNVHNFYVQLGNPQAFLDFLRSEERLKLALSPGKRSKYLLVPWEIKEPRMEAESRSMTSTPSSSPIHHGSPNSDLGEGQIEEELHTYHPWSRAHRLQSMMERNIGHRSTLANQRKPKKLYRALIDDSASAVEDSQVEESDDEEELYSENGL